MTGKIGVAKSITFTPDAGSAVTVTKVQGYDYTIDPELEDFREGDADTSSHYRANFTGYIEVTLADFEHRASLKKGSRHKDIKLVIEAAKTSAGGNAATQNYEVEMSQAVVTELGAVTRDNTSKVPSVYTVRFELSKWEATAPTMTEGFASGGSG